MLAMTICTARAFSICPPRGVYSSIEVEIRAMQGRPFRVLGLQQVAVGSADKSELRKLWVDLLGLAVVGNFRSESENVDEDIAVLGRGPLRVELDLMQPLD